MTPEAQRIAIAEACGWTFYKESLDINTRVKRPDGSFAGLMFGPECKHNPLPDYLNELNAMHLAEQWLKDNSTTMIWRRYWENLSEVCQPSVEYWRATARQRAEAFLRTIGKR